MSYKILYISYDGMTDPLGQSQVLPYLVGLTKEGYEFTILSFEKKDRFKKLKPVIEDIVFKAGIRWVPMKFTSKPPVISKAYDRRRMKRKAFLLYKKNRYDMIHCRGYVSAEVGLSLKRKKGTKFFFDMRGFWPDEKKDGGAWNQDNFIFRRVYRHYKKKETQFICEADCIISLTDAGKKEIMKWSSYDQAIPLRVIPCCADMDVFSLIKEGEREKGRQILGLDKKELIVSYLGSVGSWYMLGEMLELFATIKEKYNEAKFLFVTHSSFSLVRAELHKYGLQESDIVLVEAARNEVPLYIKASNVNISFIRAVYSKLSSSPTKLGEVLVMGIPVIVNAGVGDVKEIVEKNGGGIVIDEFNKTTYEKVVEQLPALLNSDPGTIRSKAEPIFSLNRGIELYASAYKEVFEKIK